MVVEEPLSISDYPSAIHVHPGENQTLVVSILNSAPVNYVVALIFSLNETTYQESYVTFSNSTYILVPGLNNVTAWMFVQSGAHPAWLELIIDFYRY
ncbi:MAG: hypothetical protein JSV05_10195 [Candidatus Bathyarchaeota archaeon]|nr:MAG: hypothetical protein JSV05_10195 [Candidatus Bathyarchaeota archaeon]